MNLTAIWTKRTLAHNIRHLRHDVGLTQAAVAENAGISFRLVQDLESGKGNPTLETLCALATTFKVRLDRLLQLDFLRLPDVVDDLEMRIRRGFADASIAVILRNSDGVAIWGNARSSTVLKHDFDTGPVDLLAHFSTDASGVLKNQLGAERRSYVAAYTLFTRDAATSDRTYLRCYPTLILPSKGRTSVYTTEYYAEISDDSEANYYEYCRRLLRCVYDDTKPSGRKK